MTKEISVLLVGVRNTIINDKIDVDITNSLEEAKNILKSKFYDAVVVKFKLQDGAGPSITQIYPHYRSIIIIDNENDIDELKKYRNGFHIVTTNADAIEGSVLEIVNKYPKKEQDTLMAFMNIQRSIDTIMDSNSFLKTSFNSIHTRLKNLEDQQIKINSNFESFREQKTKTEQFFIDTVLELKEKYNGN